MNSISLAGRIGQDPELRYTSSDNAVCNISIATRNYQGETDWHRVVCWGKTAENIERYLRKGDWVVVRGSLGYRKWTDREGIEKVSAEINAQEVTFMTKPTRDRNPAPKVAPAPEPAATPKDDIDALPF
jgi:single-strand DNA-binding protein